MSNNIIVSVSVLSADFSCIREVCSDIKKSGAEWVHFDVMDGLFVDNITFGTPILKRTSLKMVQIILPSTMKATATL